MAEMERMTAEEVVRHLLEDEEGADLVRESLRWLVQQLMEAEVSELIGAAHGERTDDRATWRNGYRPKAVGYPCRRARAAHPEAAAGQLLPLVSGAAAAIEAGALGGVPAGLSVRGLDPPRRPAGRVARAAHQPRRGVAHLRASSTSRSRPSASARIRDVEVLDQVDDRLDDSSNVFEQTVIYKQLALAAEIAHSTPPPWW
jgi:Transposase, Mutator family